MHECSLLACLLDCVHAFIYDCVRVCVCVVACMNAIIHRMSTCLTECLISVSRHSGAFSVPHALTLAGARPKQASLLALFHARRRCALRRSTDSCVWPLDVIGAGSFWHSATIVRLGAQPPSTLAAALDIRLGLASGRSCIGLCGARPLWLAGHSIAGLLRHLDDLRLCALGHWPSARKPLQRSVITALVAGLALTHSGDRRSAFPVLESVLALGRSHLQSRRSSVGSALGCSEF
jgi:hypothetical protein